MSGSDAIQREINPLITTESSTTITRSGSCREGCVVEELVNAILITHRLRLERLYRNDDAEGHWAAG
jgi:hypothetical protein